MSGSMQNVFSHCEARCRVFDGRGCFSGTEIGNCTFVKHNEAGTVCQSVGSSHAGFCV